MTTEIISFPARLGSRAPRWLPAWVAEHAEGSAWLGFVESVRQHHAEQSPASLSRATTAHDRWSAIFLACE